MARLCEFLQQFLQLLVGVSNLLVQVTRAALLLDGGESVRPEVLVAVHERDGSHQRAQDDLLVVGEVELEKEKRS